MGIHKSLRVKSRLARGRNVLSRDERITRLEEEELWTDGMSVFGLPKVKARTYAPPKKAESAAKKVEEAEASMAEPAAPEAKEGQQA